jgi:ADP-heptose:LPS heptosyltransferase
MTRKNIIMVRRWYRYKSVKLDPSFLIFKVNHLGDAITFLPTVAGIRKYFPNSPIDMVCDAATAGIFKKSIADIRTVPVSYTRIRSPGGVLDIPRVLAQLSVGKYEFALLSHDETKFAHLLATGALARQRIGFNLVNRGMAALLSKVLPFQNGRNVTDLNFDLVRCVTGRSGLPATRTRIGYDERDRLAVRQRLQMVAVNEDQQFVVIHPFANSSYTTWSLERYLTLAHRIEDELKIACVMVAQADTAEILWGRRITGLSIHELAALLERASLFIGNNSGPMHVAAAMATRTLIIHGPSATEWEVHWTDIPHKGVSASHLACVPCDRIGRPVGRCANLEYPNGCMKEISVDRMLREADHLLRGEA